MGTGANPRRPPARSLSLSKSQPSLPSSSSSFPPAGSFAAITSDWEPSESCHDGLAWLRDLFVHAGSPQSPESPIDLTRDPEDVLLDHFDRHVRKCLLPIMGTWLTDLFHHPDLRPAILAISASHLFQFHLFLRDPTSASCTVRKRNNTALTQAYFQYAVNHYDESIRLLATTTMGGIITVPVLNLATTLLLVLFEWESGSVGGSFIHMDGADAIALSSSHELCQTSTGRFLLQSWADMRARKNRQKLVFRPLDAELAHPLDHRSTKLSELALQFSVGLSTPLTEAYTLRNRLVLRTCAADLGVGDEDLPGDFRRWFSRAFDFDYSDEFAAQNGGVLDVWRIQQGLDATKAMLRDWFSALGDHQKPILPPNFPFRVDEDLEDQWVPLDPIAPSIFLEPEAAFDYLRYSICRVLTSPQVLHAYVVGTRPRSTSARIPAVVGQLLSVIEGLDPAQLAHYDVYDHGPIWILVTLALCVPDLAVVSYILDSAFPKFEAVTNRGSLLIGFITAKKMLQCIRSQIQGGFLPLICSANSLITEDLIASPVARFGRKWAIIGRDLSGGYKREVVCEAEDT